MPPCSCAPSAVGLVAFLCSFVPLAVGMIAGRDRNGNSVVDLILGLSVDLVANS